MAFQAQSIKNGRKIRYAIVGLGWIAQEDVMPAFANTPNSEMTALVSNDPEKLAQLSEQYGIQNLYSYDEYEDCLNSGEIDAVYIALPNHLHRDFATKAAQAGIHVLCEKPMAVTVAECEEMIQAAKESHVKLMIAYRLHFDRSTLEAINTVQSGQIGEPRIFNSVFTQPVADGNVRVEEPIEHGGGTVYDMGVYCINAARYLFGAEPIGVIALSANNGESRFEKIDEMTSAILKFPGERLATFTSSFGASSVSTLQVIGTKGDLKMQSAYGIQGELKHEITIEQETQERSFKAGDQFGAEILYFSDCIITGREPEPSGEEGLADVRIISAIYESAKTGQPVKLEPFERRSRPNLEQAIELPALTQTPEMVHASDPSGSS